MLTSKRMWLAIIKTPELLALVPTNWIWRRKWTTVSRKSRTIPIRKTSPLWKWKCFTTALPRSCKPKRNSKRKNRWEESRMPKWSPTKKAFSLPFSLVPSFSRPFWLQVLWHSFSNLGLLNPRTTHRITILFQTSKDTCKIQHGWLLDGPESFHLEAFTVFWVMRLCGIATWQRFSTTTQLALSPVRTKATCPTSLTSTQKSYLSQTHQFMIRSLTSITKNKWWWIMAVNKCWWQSKPFVMKKCISCISWLFPSSSLLLLLITCWLSPLNTCTDLAWPKWSTISSRKN